MEFMSAREAADKWGISQRRVAVLCSEQRIAEATMVGNMWIIPTSAEKPIDARSTRYSKIEEKAVKPFLKWVGAKVNSLKRLNVTIRLIVEELQNMLSHLLAAVQFCLIFSVSMI